MNPKMKTAAVIRVILYLDVKGKLPPPSRVSPVVGEALGIGLGPPTLGTGLETLREGTGTEIRPLPRFLGVEPVLLVVPSKTTDLFG